MGFNNQINSGFAANVHSLEHWAGIVKSSRNGQSKPVANNTRAEFRDGGAVAIKLHNTDIVTFEPGGRIVLNSGGWRSATTKERINRFSNAGISQRNSVWYMADGSLFYDGMAILSDGTVIKPRTTEKYEKQLAVIKKQAKEYARDFVAALKAGAVGMPSGGDCWYCSMFKGAGDNEHLRNHMAEKYFVPSLLVNAGRDAGYRDEQIGLMGIGGRQLFIDPERNIYKYLVKQLQGDLR